MDYMCIGSILREAEAGISTDDNWGKRRRNHGVNPPSNSLTGGGPPKPKQSEISHRVESKEARSRK